MNESSRASGLLSLMLCSVVAAAMLRPQSAQQILAICRLPFAICYRRLAIGYSV